MVIGLAVASRLPTAYCLLPMSSDNVTPFRRPPKRPVAPQQSGGLGFKTHRGKAVLVHLLTLVAFLLNLLPYALMLPLFAGAPQVPPIVLLLPGMVAGIFAAFLAYSNRGAAMPWANTHHEHAFRTLMIGYSLWVLAGALIYINGVLFIATLFIQVAIALWAWVRSGVGLALAIMRQPIGNPHGWLF